MLTQILFALALTSVTVVIHAAGTARVVLPLSGIWKIDKDVFQAPAAVIPIIRLVSGLLILHLAEMSVWAAAFSAVGVFQDFDTSLYFSMKSYTTVGYGDILPPVSWRLVGPMEAAVGVLMLGVSTGIIVAAIQKIHSRLDRNN